jgi:lauroyl/myristoyl acyltransferase
MVVALWFILEHLPEALTSVAGPVIGGMMLLGKKRAVLRNMKMVLGNPEWSEENWQTLYRRHVRQLGRTIVESVQLSAMPRERLLQRLHLEGEDYLRAALQEKRGVMLLVNHLGNIACVAAALGLRGYDTTIVSNMMPLKFMERKMNRFLRRCGAKRVVIGEGIVSDALQALKRNAIFAAAIDYSAISRHTMWTPFSNAQLNVSDVPVTLARLAQSAMLSVDVSPLGRNHHEFALRPIIQLHSDAGDPKSSVRIVRDEIARIGKQVSARPEQWWRWDYPLIRPATQAASPAP